MRMEQEDKGMKGMKRILLGTAAAFFCLAAGLAGCSRAPEGTPHIVTVDNFQVEPGKTTVQELGDAGFFISDSSMRKVKVSGSQVASGYEEAYDLSSEVEPRTYYYMLRLVKDGQSYASLTVVNESSSAATLADCKVRTITVYSTEQKAEEAKLDGIVMGELNVESLTETAGEPDSSKEEDGENGKRTVAKWQKGDYTMELTLNEDKTVYSFSSGYEEK